MNHQKKIAVFFGGCSTEYKVSLQSAYAVIQRIDTQKYLPVLIGISPRFGKWHWFHGELERIKEDTWLSEENCTPVFPSFDRTVHGLCYLDHAHLCTISLDAALPVLHGKNGEDGRLQGLFELVGIPFVGPGMLSSALCMDKFIAHELVRLNGIEVPKSVLLTKYNKEQKLEELNNLTYPLFVKPLKAGSSFGITKVSDKKKLASAIDFAFTYDDAVVVEENIDGFEVGCAILGNEELTIGFHCIPV